MSGQQYKQIELMRIGGEAQFLVYHKDGRIDKAYFISRAPIRGFEKIMIGKNPVFAVEASMRICGICHAAHGIAAAEAIEDAVGIIPPPNGIILREIIGLLNRIQSHLVHLVFIVRDLVVEKVAWDLMMRTIKALSNISLLLSRFGGAPTHPPYIVIGGVQEIPKQKYLEDAKKKLGEIKKEFEEISDVLFDEENWTELSNIISGIKNENAYLASHLFYGDRYNINLDKIVVKNYCDYRDNDVPDEASKTSSCVAIYGEKCVEVGPRARMVLYGKFNDNTLLGVQKARMLETIICLDRICELINEIDLSEPSKTVTLILRRGRGVGVYEAPRGTLIHFVEIDNEGRISMHRIVVPTMFNIPIIEKSSIGLPLEVADLIPRLYDPCIPCSTHLIEVK